MKTQTRREFVAGACLFAGTLALGGVAKAVTPEEAELLRPPGGQDESSLRALCIKCDRCRSACPQHCVEPAAVSDGFLLARTPKLNFHRGLCDFCGKCIDACPTGALHAFDPYADKIGIARINTEKCISYTRGTCTVCQGSCPYDALTFNENNHPEIDASLCNGCGACVMVCTSNVNRAFDGNRERAVEVWPEVSE